ncbi:recombinase family protein [Vibrio parahaemolyticus]|uniref:recombinase family protein n=1 Tax=Vibrio parahaemolyticus TaxID=670 RepID=UPI00084B5EF5|nr:recombinase family protein [Vibrio parahaemolyticus]EHR1002464.1 recombinase family protein [Vibrio parahaemolyticus]EIU6861929.1 recombinase family protein [Vibrio parahaemolyticus]EIU7062484.1 recombinase family protein [Vibrio parahaemolyticus]EIW7863568.1 recombinase family protein [Vibrio parahaemolyticus]ELA7258756.1 recombinase family protein [Vibrio parahaemolyticus]
MRTTPKIYNYARVSTTKQTKGVGLETQQQRSVLENLSQEHNLPIHDENFVDQGLSAYHGKHKDGAFGVVLSRIESGEIASGSILVVFSLDRLSRETVNVAMEQFLSIINRGVRVYTHIDCKMFDSESQNQTADLIGSLITMQRANEESETKSKRIIAAQKIALKRWKDTGKPQGALGRSPFWIDQPTNTLNINAEGVKKAVEMKLAGYGDLKIKQYLDANFEYKQTRTKGTVKQSNTWDYTAISQLWANRSLIGEKNFHIEGVSHVFENYYPPIIDEATFRKLKMCKSEKRGRNTSTGKIPLLKGIARCGICGGAMVFVDKGDNRVNYVCNLAMKGEHDREVYNVNMLDLLTLEICKDAYLAESDKTNNTFVENEKIKIETELVEEREVLDELVARFKAKKSNTILDLIGDSENQIDVLEAKLDAINNADVVLNADELVSLPEIFTDDVRTDYLHPERYTIRNNLYRFISSITLNRVVEHCSDAKIKSANCIDITWHFKNGQKRRLAMLPYQYLKADDGRKSLYLPFVYMYGSKSNIKVDDGGQFLPSIFEKLHAFDLTKCLYPSRGCYQWSKLSLECGKTYWAPLDKAMFMEKGMEVIADTVRDNGGTNKVDGVTTNYLSLMFNYPSSEEFSYDYPDSTFVELACKFGFVADRDFSLFLQDNNFNRELYSSLDFLMS